MSYDTVNRNKADFNAAYTAPTPHAYLETMFRVGYEIPERARPFLVAAAELLDEPEDDEPSVQMLDVGCSYGIGAASVKYGRSFEELVSFFSRCVPTKYDPACRVTRAWLGSIPPELDMDCVGLDSSCPAVRFARDTGLLDGGIARNLEEPGTALTEEERDWLRGCNLLVSTGAIGYVSDRTLDIVLHDLGKGDIVNHGPFSVMTILRMFDITPIRVSFEKHGYKFSRVSRVRLPQRRFATERERQRVLSLLHNRGLDTSNFEDRGKYFADLYVAAPPEQFQGLYARMAARRPNRLS